MPKEEIVEGLKAAVRKGEPLSKAMMSFYNSGYAKEDVEEAARVLDAPQMPTQNLPTQQTQSKAQIQVSQVKTKDQNKPETSESHYVPQPSSPATYPQSQFGKQETEYQKEQSLQQQQAIQKVSAYGSKPSAVSAAVIFILVFFLLFLVGVLIAVFLFKDELAGFFSGL